MKQMCKIKVSIIPCIP